VAIFKNNHLLWGNYREVRMGFFGGDVVACDGSVGFKTAG